MKHICDIRDRLEVALDLQEDIIDMMTSNPSEALRQMLKENNEEIKELRLKLAEQKERAAKN